MSLFSSLFQTLKFSIKDYLQTVRRIQNEDPAVNSRWEPWFCYPGLKAIFFHRWAHVFYRHRLFLAARMISQINRFLTGIEIHPGAQLGQRIFIDHGSGVVIGETTEIGDDCVLYHGITLGGVSQRRCKRHPTLGKKVIVGTGSKILGPVVIGDGAKIAAGAIIIEDIAEGITIPLQMTKTDLNVKIF